MRSAQRTDGLRGGGWMMALVALLAWASGGARAESSLATFAEYAAEATPAALAHRLLSPLAGARELAAAGAGATAPLVDLSAERFVLHVPSPAPEHGYALLVFVPPWQEARIPPGWDRVLDRSGVIFVSAARSGNDESPRGRRIPLALLAAHNVLKRYPVDPARVYIAGFSGGSRIALRLALGYPDLFSGVILDAGSDAIGTSELPLPPAALMARFQASTRVVFLTGERDVEHLNEDQLSLRSLHRWCVENIDTYAEPRLGHLVASPASLERALRSLSAPRAPDERRLAQCRGEIEVELERQFADIEALLEAGERARARAALAKLDAAYGGLAAPRSVELQGRL